MTGPKPNDLRVWYTTDPPRKALHINATNLREALRILGVIEAVTAYETVNGIRREVTEQSGVRRYEPDGAGGHEWSDVDDHELIEVADILATQ